MCSIASRQRHCRSSVIISDEPLHRESNYRTEFVIALNNQPQGGIITRARSPDVRLVRHDFGFGWAGWGFNNTPVRGGQYYDAWQNNRSYYQRLLEPVTQPPTGKTVITVVSCNSRPLFFADPRNPRIPSSPAPLPKRLKRPGDRQCWNL